MDRTYSRILQELEAGDNLRILREMTPQGKYLLHGGKMYLNLSSNDYLGIAGDPGLQAEFMRTVTGNGRFLMGNPSSRLMTGNSPEYHALEETLSALYGPGHEALVFASGYLANSSLPGALTSTGDVILADRLVHASIVDGLRLSGRGWERFRHNDAGHLEQLILKHRSRTGTGDIWVITESVFSMDGDRAPLKELVELKEKYGLQLYVDEAHAFGVLGPKGKGLASELGLGGRIDVLVGTLGKSAASHGGFAITSPVIKQVLVNRARGVIFSTALPPWSLLWSAFTVGRMAGMDDRRAKLHRLAEFLSPGSPSHIIPVMVPGNDRAGELATRLREAGYWVTPIRYPTVPKGQERVRLSLTAALDEEDLIKLRQLCDTVG